MPELQATLKEAEKSDWDAGEVGNWPSLLGGELEDMVAAAARTPGGQLTP